MISMVNRICMARDRRWNIVGGASLTVIAVVMLMTVGDYGLTWDEEFQSIYGELVLAWFQSGFTDQSALFYKNLYLYGSFFDVLAQLFARMSPLDLYEDRHLVNIAFAILGLGGTWRLGTLVLGNRGGVLAMVLTALTPMFYGHSFNNPKDIPFAAVSVWTLCHLYEAARPVPKTSTWAIAKLTISFGALLAIRPAGIFFLAYIILWWSLSLLRAGSTRGRDLVRATAPLVIVLLGAWTLMLSLWPWAQLDPIINPLRAMRNAARFSFTGTTLFFGQYVPARPAPLEYLPTWFALQLPETYVAALAAGVIGYVVRRRLASNEELSAARQRRFVTIRTIRMREIPQRLIFGMMNRLAHSPESMLAAGFLAFVVLLPILMAMVLRSTLYDGVRHFLFVIPPLAVLAAAGIESGLRPPVPSVVRVVIACGLLSAAAVTVWDMVALHPYQSVYFNRLLAGGLAGAAGRFETDYWGNSYREAVEWVVKNVPGEGIRIANCSYPLQSSYYLRGSSGARFVPVPMDAKPDLLLATTRWDCHRKTGARVVHTVERQGVALVYVLDLRP